MNQDELQNTVLCGDALEVLKRLPDEYVQMCVTSPPYPQERQPQEILRQVRRKSLQKAAGGIRPQETGRVEK